MLVIASRAPRSRAPITPALLIAAGLSCSVTLAETPQQLVDQLADLDYATREAAEQRLVDFGPAALPAVEAAAASIDPEQRCRAARLLVRLRRRCFEQQLELFVRDVAGRGRADLPGWREFEQLAGPSAASRRVFAEMFRADPWLITAAFEPPADQPSAEPLSKLLERRAAGLQSYTTGRGPEVGEPGDPIAATLAALCVAASRPEAVSKRSCQLLTQLARSELSPVAQRDGSRPRAARRLLAQWIVSSRTDDLYLLSPMLQLAQDLELRDAAPLAIAIATGDRPVRPTSAQFRASVLLKVGKLATADDIGALAPLLDDHAVCAPQAGRGGEQAAMLDVEVRDVALAVMLHLAGEKPSECGFENAAEHADRLFVLRTLAFRSEQHRGDAVARWRREHAAIAPPIRIAAGGDSAVR